MNQEEDQLITLKYNSLIKLMKTFFIDLITINFTIFINICSLIHLLIKNYFDCLVNAFKYSYQIAQNIWIYFETNFKLIRYVIQKCIKIITSNDEEQLKMLDEAKFKNE